MGYKLLGNMFDAFSSFVATLLQTRSDIKLISLPFFCAAAHVGVVPSVGRSDVQVRFIQLNLFFLFFIPVISKCTCYDNHQFYAMKPRYCCHPNERVHFNLLLTYPCGGQHSVVHLPSLFL